MRPGLVSCVVVPFVSSAPAGLARRRVEARALGAGGRFVCGAGAVGVLDEPVEHGTNSATAAHTR